MRSQFEGKCDDLNHALGGVALQWITMTFNLVAIMVSFEACVTLSGHMSMLSILHVLYFAQGRLCSSQVSSNAKP
jgi:hypothetical protein